MRESNGQFPVRRRARWPVVVGVLLFLFVGFGVVPIIWNSVLFRDSVLIGMTSSQVLARCGEPQFASAVHPAEPYTPSVGEPVWFHMDQSGRDQLVHREEFMLGYRGSLGDQYSVYFKDGRVVRIERSSK